MSDELTIPEKVISFLRKKPMTYLELGTQIYGTSLTREQKGYLKIVMNRLKKRGLIVPMGETRKRCNVYKAKEGNMLFIKDTDLRKLQKGYINYENLFRDLSEKENLVKVLKGDLKTYQILLKDNIDFKLRDELNENYFDGDNRDEYE